MTVYEQLKEFCDCLPEDIEDEKDEAFQRNVNEMIDLVSVLTCWAQKPCETLLNSERTEYMDLKRLDPCACNGGVVVFKPFYRVLQPDTFKVYLIEVRGLDETVTPVTEFAYSETFGELRINVAPYLVDDRCGCPAQRRLRITYDAGYPELPDCLLQLFCDLLHVIADKNNCDCEACQACKPGSEDKVVEFLDGDEVSPRLDVYLNRLVESGYKQQLGLISLCDYQPEIWGTVV